MYLEAHFCGVPTLCQVDTDTTPHALLFLLFFSSSLSPPHLLLVVGIKPGALPMLREHLTTKIYPPLCLRYFYGKIAFKKMA